jgi:hypothetical protein
VQSCLGLRPRHSHQRAGSNHPARAPPYARNAGCPTDTTRLRTLRAPSQHLPTAADHHSAQPRATR